MSFKTFDLAHDVASVVSAINEVVQITSSLFALGGGDANVKLFNNISSGTGAVLGGYWETVYDSATSSLSSTALMDITFGYAATSSYNTGVNASSSQDEKVKVYREMASALLGNADSLFTVNSLSKTECFFLLLKRTIMKDELKKGSVSVILSGANGAVTATDTNAASAFKQTIGGDYAPLFSGSTEVGQVWYNAGVIVIPVTGTGIPWTLLQAWSGSTGLSGSATGTMAYDVIDASVKGLRSGHLLNINFHNQTNLYSTIYFCRATNTEFNYSSNPTFVDSDKRIRVTSGSNVLQTRTYITTIGLYDANDNLLAVGKVSKPITKSPDTESIFQIRLDY